MVWTGALNAGGYGLAQVNGVMGGIHRHLWIEVMGPIPEGLVVDHLCHVRNCAALKHLRLATSQQNASYRKGAQSNSVSGVRGVSWCPKKLRWRASAVHARKTYHVGYFRDLEEAAEATKRKRLELRRDTNPYFGTE